MGATTLDRLGPRICIVGPSNSGKSTLARAIARARGLPAIHLDQLYHRPGTQWQPRAPGDFAALHQAAIDAPCWVIDGGYAQCLEPRLERATGLVLLDASTATSLLRYLRRTWFERARHGMLEGARDRVTWAMIRHITTVTPANRRHYRTVFDQTALPKIRLATPRELAQFYRAEGLER